MATDTPLLAGAAASNRNRRLIGWISLVALISSSLILRRTRVLDESFPVRTLKLTSGAFFRKAADAHADGHAEAASSKSALAGGDASRRSRSQSVRFSDDQDASPQARPRPKGRERTLRTEAPSELL